LLCGFAHALAPAPADIVWKPKAGDTAKYKLEIVPEAPFDMKIVMEITSKVAKVEQGKITVESTTSSPKMYIDGQEQTIPQNPVSETHVYDANHETLSTNLTTDAAARMSDATALILPGKPVSPGDTWKRTRKASKELRTMDSETVYTYDGDETVGKWKCFRIKFSFKETSGEHILTNSGTAWISVDDGSLVKSEMKTVNYEYSPGTFGNSTSTMSRLE